MDYNQQGGPRGEGKAESVNWGMLMEQHKLGKGTILFRQMFSAESLTSPHPGFPELFQTGETYHGEPLVDHQHPHNVFAELALLYTLPLTEKLSWEFYGGPSAEPALGPVTYIHRASAVGAAAGSARPSFAGFDPHQLRRGHDRIHDRPRQAGSFRFQRPRAERGTLEHPAGERWIPGRGGPSLRLRRTGQRNTALDGWSIRKRSNRAASGGRLHLWSTTGHWRPANWATTLIWGRVHKIATDTTLNSYLLESTLNFRERNYAFSRLELVDKDELFPQAPVHPVYRIGAYTLGGVRDLIHDRAWQLGLGADVTFYSKAAVLDPAYGDHPVSFQIFIRMRPGRSDHSHLRR